jgi:DNA-binding transcriptional LysR family regulator
VLIASPQHRLAGRPHIQIRDLGAELLIAHQTTSPSRAKVAEAFRRSRTSPKVAKEAASVEEIKQVVAANVGVGFVPLTFVREEVERRELIIIPVEDFRHERTLWAVRRRTTAHSRAAQAFLQVIVEVAKKLFQSEPHARLTQTKENGGYEVGVIETGHHALPFFTFLVSLLDHCQHLIAPIAQMGV